MEAVTEEIAEKIPLRKDQYGVYRVGGTRVMLDLVLYSFKRGQTPEQIAEEYSTLRLPDIYLVLGYYLRHQPEFDAYMERREREEDELVAAHPEWRPEGLRARMLELQAKQKQQKL
jgi:uncharacterized protein (DUF433 family)